MLTRVDIHDYRTCFNSKFKPQHDLSVLIGPNGSGKTNLLNAVMLLNKLVEEEPHFHDEQPTGHCKLKAEFSIDGKKVILTANIDTYTDEYNNDNIISSRQEWYMKDFTGSAKRVLAPLWFVRHYTEGAHSRAYRYVIPKYAFDRARDLYQIPEQARKPLSFLAGYLADMKYYSASQFTNPSSCPVSFEIEQEGRRSRGLKLKGHTKFLYDLYSQFKANTPSFQQFIEIIGPDGIGLIDKVDFKEILTSSTEFSVRSGGKVEQRKRDKILVIPQFAIGRHELSPNQLSEGTFKTITLLFYLVTETSSLLLVEEPEVCVHHGLLASIIELIKHYSNDKQIIISTHSDFVLDKVKPINVYKVSGSSTNGTSVFHIPNSMSKRELVALRRYLETEGNLGEYWRHGGLE